MRGTLTKKADIERLFDEGRAARTHFLTVIVRECGGESARDGRLMIVAGRSIGNAVRRNRAKRVLREAVRRAGGPWPGHHVAVIARPSALSASPADLDEALSSALDRAGVKR
ncbi:ribonuclease P protein component [Coriobacteriia bacterium Es71-Z0120]|uniref:ribonuclease P protein component n=1 Tax=Parvivirga hydrogeniphila TaxID=2939460 RepID=UPI002260D68F|nr:ribonuclease P protein component [Parvivirga hydrogeniphila]MCL4078187.1 ribonuclease P protein component [Parvivirga hydrogeniphila]